MPVSEKEIAAIAVAPRVTKQELDAAIHRIDYFTAADGVRGATPNGLRTTVPHDSLKLLTICVITLKNGFSVRGESACASPENFNKELGQRLAYENAFSHLWPLFGFKLKDQLSQIDKAGKVTGKITELGDVKTYIGTKVIRAVPMNREQYVRYRGWELPENENASDEGYLVEYTDGGASNVEGHAGYVSWSPKDVFEKAYTVGTKPKETTFLDRLIVEFEELNTRVGRLQDFITGGAIATLHVKEQEDLLDQLKHMVKYRDVLSRRIARQGK
jgi:Phage protein (N4 Gp49/phage Sf6 gene 66) family